MYPIRYGGLVSEKLQTQPIDLLAFYVNPSFFQHLNQCQLNNISILFYLQIAPDFFPKLLEKGLQVAESQAADSFHCKTLNCPGWCTYDDDVNFFLCEVCKQRNCLTCQAIHTGQNCKEYQDDLKRKAEIDVEARKTQEELEVSIYRK